MRTHGVVELVLNAVYFGRPIESVMHAFVPTPSISEKWRFLSGHRISGHYPSVHVELPVFQLLVETFQKLPIIEDIDRNYEIICLYN